MPRIAVLGLGLCLVVAAAPVEGQTPVGGATQAFLEYADSAYTEIESLSIETDSFLEPRIVVEIATLLGLAHGPRSELVQCSEDRSTIALSDAWRVVDDVVLFQTQ